MCSVEAPPRLPWFHSTTPTEEGVDRSSDDGAGEVALCWRPFAVDFWSENRSRGWCES
jgi:hypothetical protein